MAGYAGSAAVAGLCPWAASADSLRATASGQNRHYALALEYPRPRDRSYLAGAPRKFGNDRCQFVGIHGLGHMDLKPRRQRQQCVVLLDKRGERDGR